MRTSKFIAFTLLASLSFSTLADAQTQAPAAPPAVQPPAAAPSPAKPAATKKKPAPPPTVDSLNAQAQKYQQAMNDPDLSSDADIRAALYQKWVDVTCQAKQLQVRQLGLDASLAATVLQKCKTRLMNDPSAAVAAATPPQSGSSSSPKHGASGSNGSAPAGQPCVVIAAPATISGSNSTYTYNVQCSAGVVPNSMTIVTPVASNLVGFALEQGVSRQTTSADTDKKITTVSFAFNPDARTRKLSLTVPTASIEEKSVSYYIASKSGSDSLADSGAISALGNCSSFAAGTCSIATVTVPVPKAPPVVTATCPGDPRFATLPVPSLAAVASGDSPKITATIKPDKNAKPDKNVTTKVQVCADSTLYGTPVAASSDDPNQFTISGGGKLTPGQKLQAQLVQVDASGSTKYSEPGSIVLVDSCKMVAKGTDKGPTLTISHPDDSGEVSFSGKVPNAKKDTIIRVCTSSDSKQDPLPVLDSKGSEVIAKTTDDTGNFDSSSVKFKVKIGDQIVAQTESTEKPPNFGQLSSVVSISSEGLVVGTPPTNPMVSIIVGGVEQSGYSSLGSNTGGFISAYLRSPYLAMAKNSPFGLAMWGRVRLLSTPQPGVVGISSILTNPTGQITTQSFSSIGAAVDYVIGPEIKFFEGKADSSKYRLSMIAGIGATSPFSTNNVTISYAAPPALSAQCTQLLQLYGANNKYGNNPYLFANPSPASCIYNPQNGQPYSYVSFVNENRSNFFFKWGVGGRFTHIYPAKDKTPSYAGSLDFVVGQDATITGGKVSGWVAKLDGVYPIPFTGSLLYVFGTAAMRFRHNVDYPLLPLPLASNVPAPPSPQVAILSQQQPNRDFYRLGFGLNLGTIFCKFSTSGCTQNNSNPTGTGSGSGSGSGAGSAPGSGSGGTPAKPANP